MSFNEVFAGTTTALMGMLPRQPNLFSNMPFPSEYLPGLGSFSVDGSKEFASTHWNTLMTYGNTAASTIMEQTAAASEYVQTNVPHMTQAATDWTQHFISSKEGLMQLALATATIYAARFATEYKNATAMVAPKTTPNAPCSAPSDVAQPSAREKRAAEREQKRITAEQKAEQKNAEQQRRRAERAAHKAELSISSASESDQSDDELSHVSASSIESAASDAQATVHDDTSVVVDDYPAADVSSTGNPLEHAQTEPDLAAAAMVANRAMIFAGPQSAGTVDPIALSRSSNPAAPADDSVSRPSSPAASNDDSVNQPSRP